MSNSDKLIQHKDRMILKLYLKLSMFQTEGKSDRTIKETNFPHK